MFHGGCGDVCEQYQIDPIDPFLVGHLASRWNGRNSQDGQPYEEQFRTCSRKPGSIQFSIPCPCSLAVHPMQWAHPAAIAAVGDRLPSARRAKSRLTGLWFLSEVIFLVLDSSGSEVLSESSIRPISGLILCESVITLPLLLRQQDGHDRSAIIGSDQMPIDRRPAPRHAITGCRVRFIKCSCLFRFDRTDSARAGEHMDVNPLAASASP